MNIYLKKMMSWVHDPGRVSKVKVRGEGLNFALYSGTVMFVDGNFYILSLIFNSLGTNVHHKKVCRL